MFTVLGALQACTQMLLAIVSSASMVMVTTHQQIVLNAFLYGVLHLAQEAVGMYFQRWQLGAESSGGMLAGDARGHWGLPPKTSDWGNAGCVKRTRFMVVQIHLLLLSLGMMRPDGTLKRYHVYQSNKLYCKRQLNGQLRNRAAKHFYVTAQTALLMLLINLAQLIAFYDMQALLNGIPSPEISLIVNFMLEYVEPWCAACQDLSTWLPRFHLYADAIVAKGSHIGAGNDCQVVGFTDSTLILTCRPHGNENCQHKIHDFTQFDGNHRLHGHKFLGLLYPDSLIAMYGPYGRTRHNGVMFLAARIVVTLMHFRAVVKCTVLVIQQIPTNCVQANDDNLRVLPHIIFYLSTRQPQIIGNPSHAVPRFFSKNGLDVSKPLKTVI